MTQPDPGPVDFADLLGRLDEGSAYAADFYDRHYAAVKAAAPEDRPRVLAEWREEATLIAEHVLLIRAGIADWIDAEAAGMAAEAMAAAQPPPRLLPGAAEHAARIAETWAPETLTAPPESAAPPVDLGPAGEPIERGGDAT